MTDVATAAAIAVVCALFAIGSDNEPSDAFDVCTVLASKFEVFS